MWDDSKGWLPIGGSLTILLHNFDLNFVLHRIYIGKVLTKFFLQHLLQSPPPWLKLCFYRKDIEPLFHYFMYSHVSHFFPVSILQFSILKVYQLVLKNKSQKIKFPGISPKSPQKEAFIGVTQAGGLWMPCWDNSLFILTQAPLSPPSPSG